MKLVALALVLSLGATSGVAAQQVTGTFCDLPHTVPPKGDDWQQISPTHWAHSCNSETDCKRVENEHACTYHHIQSACAATGASSGLGSAVAGAISSLPPNLQIGALEGLAVIGILGRMNKAAQQEKLAKAMAEAAETAAREQEAQRAALERLRRARETADYLLQNMLGVTQSQLQMMLPGNGTTLGFIGPDSAPLRSPNDTDPLFSRPSRWVPVDLRRVQAGAALLAAADGVPESDRARIAEAASAIFDGTAPIPNMADTDLPVINEAGLRAFQIANAEYRLAHDDGAMLFKGSAAADAEYLATRSTLQEVVAEMARSASQPGQNANQVADLRDNAEAAQNALNGLEDLRNLSVVDATRVAINAANNWRRDFAETFAVWGTLKDDWAESMNFVADAERACAGSTDRYCKFRYTEAHKNDVPAKYPARRNVEHMYLNELLITDPTRYKVPGAANVPGLNAIATPVIGIPLTLVATPAYTIHKLAYPKEFRTSPPTAQELLFGYIGMLRGIAHYIPEYDPEKMIDFTFSP